MQGLTLRLFEFQKFGCDLLIFAGIVLMKLICHNKSGALLLTIVSWITK
jgi:hypothetical protein